MDEAIAADADIRLIRALLRARASDAALQDQIDCAEIALDLGRRDLAAMLLGACCLRMGFAPAAYLRLQAANARGALWPDLGPPPEPDPTRAFSVDSAIAELTRLMRIGVTDSLPSAGPTPLSFDGGGAPGVLPASGSLTKIAERASHVLQQVPSAAADGSLASLLKSIRHDIAPIAPVRLEEHLALPLQALGSLYALEQVRRFLVVNAGLFDGDDAAPGLFDAALRLSPTALGPFFANVRLVIRDARDIFGMIDVAAGGNIAPADVEYWCVLLSAHLAQDQLLELIDELGDRGMTLALTRILTRATRADGPHYPADIVWRIRDACLDIGEFGVAADAQQLISLWRPHDVNEWRILADIRAALGDAIGVEGALDRAALLRPNDPATREQMAAWKAGLPRRIEGGYSTSPGRRRLRLARVAAYRAMA